MLTLIFVCFLAAILVLSISLNKVYDHMPKKELRRQARQGDEVARLLYLVVGFGQDVKIFFWFLIGLSSSLLFVIIANSLSPLMAFVVVLAFVWLCFVWLPNTHMSSFSIKIARFVSPVVHWLLERLQPVIKKVDHFISRHRPVSVHTGLFTKQDIIELIDQQKIQIDNRITKEELNIVTHALSFGDKTVGDVITPKRMIKMASTHDMIGPVLMDTLHKSGHSRFPVKHDDPNHVDGILYLRDLLGAKAGGFVKDVMKKKVYYVNEDQPLPRVLDAFLKTKHHLYIVVNEFEEIVGLITIEDILEQVLGRQIIDEFDAYDDLRAVAKMQAAKDRKNHESAVNDTKDKHDLKEEEIESSK